jgi:hypothetical protein
VAAVPRGVGVVVSRWTVRWETTAGVRWMEQEAQSRLMALGKGCWLGLGLGWDGQRQRDEQRYVTVRSVSSRSLAASTLHIPDSLSLLPQGEKFCRDPCALRKTVANQPLAPLPTCLSKCEYHAGEFPKDSRTVPRRLSQLHRRQTSLRRISA